MNQSPKTVEGFIGKAEVAKRLNRSLKTVNNWMRRGILPYYKPGRSVLFRWSDVEEHLKANYLRARRQIWGQAHFPIRNDLRAFPTVKSGVAFCRRREASCSRRDSFSGRT